jgi:beta-lactamase regulating signal transducer with metallopeptidase domain
MPSIIFYILKLSVALAVVYIFYLLVLRRLTFYNWNRWYLLGYTILAFLIPFINITPILESNEWADIRIINWVPAITENDSLQTIHDNAGINLSAWNIITLVFFSGMLFLFARLMIQFISFYRMKKRAKPFAKNGLTIYQVNENIIPFSFGNSIFINHQLHSEEELREIIRHEFIHVKQNHSIDIIWGELLCLINWYNPFAWLLKKAIRQNLEFIADNKVVQNGIDKKEYQYLLLKVIGNSQYSIANQFNFSSLKKRIAMMNKTKSARLQVGRFLFLVPVFAIILLAFRQSFNDSTNAKPNTTRVILADTIPDVNTLNSKDYYIDIKDNKGNCMVVIKGKDKKEVKRLLLTEWNEKSGYYENLYGEILNPTKVEIEKMIKASNPEIRTVAVKNNIATVTLNNGKKEVYTLSLSPEKKAFENKYCLPNSALVPTGSLQKVQVDGEVETLAEIKEEPIKELSVADLDIEKIEVAEAITVTGVKSTVSPTSTKPELAEVTVVGKKSVSPAKTTTLVTTTKPAIEEVIVIGKPTKAITGNVVEEPIGTLQEKRILHLGGLTILDEGQYILLDGKEVQPASYGKLTGPYRITFIDGKNAEKKYGSKGKNGAILLDTIR